MTSSHLQAVLFGVCFHGVLGLSCYGWGKAFMSFLAPAHGDQERTLTTFSIWAGWAVTLFVFQLIHFVLPLNFLSVSPVLSLGLTLSALFLIRQHRRKTGLPRLEARTLHSATWPAVLSVLLLLLSAWLVSRAMLPASHYDSGLYHFNSVRWINSYAIVPGLGNLHGRLAFNQSFFSYVAALNLHPIFGHGRSIANSSLWLLSLLTLLEVTLSAIRARRSAGGLTILQWAPALFSCPTLVFWALSSDGIQSPSPDLSSSLLQMVMFVVFCRVVAAFVRDATVSRGDSILILLLGATAITVKLSNVAFCGTMMILTFIAAVKTSEKRLANSVRMLLPSAMVIMVFCLRGLVLSGAPFYPSTFAYVNTEWSVPVDRVVEEANWVYSWARQPDTHWRDVLGKWDWLSPWAHRVAWELIRVVYPVMVFLLLSALNVVAVLCFKHRATKRPPLHLIVLLPLFSGLAFWFATAPEPRLANALFLLLPICALLLLAVDVHQRVRSRTFVVIIGALFIFSNFNLFYWAYRDRRTLGSISLSGYQAVQRVPLKELVTGSGLRIFTPVDGDQCWDAPLPCTPYFREDLRLRSPGDLSSGFTVSAPGGEVAGAGDGGAAVGESAVHRHRGEPGVRQKRGCTK